MSLAEYIQETRGEMRHVSWPHRRQVAVFTATVVSVSIVVSLFLGLFDFMFGAGLRTLVRLSPNRASIDLPADLGGGGSPRSDGVPTTDVTEGGPGAPAPTPPLEAPGLEFKPL